jgi:hypothetical protein
LNRIIVNIINDLCIDADGLIGIGIAAFASGLFVGGLAAFVRDFAATLAKKN